MSQAQRGYREPPAVGDEASTLLGSLERQRATLAWKCADLTPEQLGARVGASDLTLGRLLKHLAYMEDLNFTHSMAGLDLPAPWTSVEAETRWQWAFTSADDDSPETLDRLWREAVERSRTVTRDVLERGGPDATFRLGDEHEVTVRRQLVDMIEEYARHTGHADLLRESVDGRVGEDPPGPAEPFTFATEVSDVPL